MPADVRLLGDVFGAPFDRAYWERNSPLVLARSANLSGLKIYFDCGMQDDYGFNVGAQALHDTLAARHIWCRRFDWADDLLRFGLPPDDRELERLAAALGLCG